MFCRGQLAVHCSQPLIGGHARNARDGRNARNARNVAFQPSASPSKHAARQHDNDQWPGHPSSRWFNSHRISSMAVPFHVQSEMHALFDSLNNELNPFFLSDSVRGQDSDRGVTDAIGYGYYVR